MVALYENCGKDWAILQIRGICEALGITSEEFTARLAEVNIMGEGSGPIARACVCASQGSPGKVLEGRHIMKIA